MAGLCVQIWYLCTSVVDHGCWIGFYSCNVHLETRNARDTLRFFPLQAPRADLFAGCFDLSRQCILGNL